MMIEEDKNKIIELFETGINIDIISKTLGLDSDETKSCIMQYYNCYDILHAKRIVRLLRKIGINFKDVILAFENTLKVSDVEKQIGIKKSLLTEILLVYYRCATIPEAKAIILSRKKIQLSSTSEQSQSNFTDKVITLFNQGINILYISEQLKISSFYIKKIILNYYNCSSLFEAKKMAESENIFDPDVIYNIINIFKQHRSIKQTSLETGLPSSVVKKIIHNYFNCLSVVEIKSKIDANKLDDTELIDNVINVFKNNSAISSTSTEMGIPDDLVKKIILDYYKCDSIEEARKISGAKKQLSLKYKEHLINVNNLYNELGSLEKVAETIGVTRERVRQLLKKGESYDLYHYVKYRVQRFEVLKNQIDKKFLESILIKKSKREVLELLNVSDADLNKLIFEFDIDYQSLHDKYLEWRKLEEMQNYSREYYKIVDELGEHPSTTYLNQDAGKRSLLSKINRLWGNINEFRKQLDVGEINYKRGNVEYLKRSLDARKDLKEYNKDLVLEIISKIQPVSIKSIHKLMSELSFGTIQTYISELLESGLIVKTYDGRVIFYVISSNN